MRKLAMVLAGSSAAVLVAMTLVSLTTGASQEIHEHVAAPDLYATALLAHPAALRGLMGLDIAFLVLYTAFFAALAAYLRELDRPFTHLALGAMVLTALLDIVEDHHILAMLRQAELHDLPSPAAIAFQSVESATKFSVSFFSLVMFGLAIPRTTKLGWVLCLFLTIGTLASAIAGYAVGPDLEPAFDSGRWIGFLAGFTLALAWLGTQPDSVKVHVAL